MNKRVDNVIDSEAKQLIEQENMLVMREAKTGKSLGVAFSEEGLRGLANKNGVYIFCDGRVTDYKQALKAPKSDKVIVEKFKPINFKDKKLATCEIMWVLYAKEKINLKS